jgi:hypothetical protein
MALVKHPWTLLDIAGRKQGFNSPRLQIVHRQVLTQYTPADLITKIPRYPGISVCIQGKLDGLQIRTFLDIAGHKQAGVGSTPLVSK